MSAVKVASTSSTYLLLKECKPQFSNILYNTLGASYTLALCSLLPSHPGLRKQKGIVGKNLEPQDPVCAKTQWYGETGAGDGGRAVQQSKTNLREITKWNVWTVQCGYKKTTFFKKNYNEITYGTCFKTFKKKNDEANMAKQY